MGGDANARRVVNGDFALFLCGECGGELILAPPGPRGRVCGSMIYVLAAFALYLLAKRVVPRWMSWKTRSPVERSFAMRFTIFSWLLAFIFIVAILFLPNKGRVLMLIPVFLAGMSLAKWWQNTRERLRRESEAASNFERARRIN